MKRKIFIVPILALMAIIISSCGNKEGENNNPCELSGAGARVPEPFYLMAFDAYNTSCGNTVKYDDIGSSNGLLKLKDKTVDFAASDEFVTDEEIAKMQPLIHIPTCVVAAVFSYNIPEVSKLNLSGNVIAAIYSGKITSWDDARIKALNPKTELPAKKITPIFRSDTNCMNYLLTSFLSDESNDWKEKYGVTKTIKLPLGKTANCNADVATKLQATPYSIGYLGSEYALVLKLPMAALKNANGEFITPNVESIAKAATGKVRADTRSLVINSPIKGAYPISFFTWLIVYQEQNYNNRTEEQARATVNLLKFILGNETHQTSIEIGFAPLPKSMIINSMRNLRKITYNGKPILTYYRR